MRKGQDIFGKPWTSEEKAALKSAGLNKQPHQTLRQVAIDVAAKLGRTGDSAVTMLRKLLMTPERRQRYLETERRRYRGRVPAFRNKEDQIIVSSRPTEEAVAAQIAYLSAPARDLTGLICGDPPLGYSALERRR